METQERTFEMEMKLRLQSTSDLICNKLEIKPLDINFKYMKEKSLYLGIVNTILISKDYLENFYYCLALIIVELSKHDLSENIKPKLYVLFNAFSILSKKKIITVDIKDELMELGFKEVNIGYKDIHKINSKELRFDFFGYDVVVGVFARCISYGCNRLYRALVINL